MKQILSKSVVIVGLMGTGKSSLGNKLAKTLGVLHSDSDMKIEKLSGKSIPRIFKESGESYFREFEEKVFCDLFAMKPHIISSGGGTILSNRSRAQIAKKSFSIWLKSTQQVILGRLKADTHRPLLLSGNREEILRKNLNDRKKFYSRANLHLNNNNESLEKLIPQIKLELINEKVLICHE